MTVPIRAVLVGEAWGKNESRAQHPLVGFSGRELSLQLGHSGFAPYISMICRNPKCKETVDFIIPRCPHCAQFLWPDEFVLIAHWKRLRLDFGIAVTNVFNVQPPGNDLGFFFGTEKETPMAPWRASQHTGGSHLKAQYFFHVKRLWREIDDYNPNLVVAMGNAALWALTNNTLRITEARGTITLTDIPEIY